MERTTTLDDGSRALRRPVHGRLIAGVAAGLADYFGIDVVIVRLTLAVLVLVGGIGLPLYVAAWLLVPEEGADQSLAEYLLDLARIGPTVRPTDGSSTRSFPGGGDAAAS
jgi:phage shock protein C